MPRADRLLLLAAAAALGCSSPSPSPSPREPVATPSEVTYPVRRDVENLLDDEAGFARFALAVRRDIEQRLARPPASTEVRKTDLFDLALLEALDGQWERAERRILEVIELEQDPALRLMTGLTIRVWVAARRAGGEPTAAFGTALDAAIAAMPYDVVSSQLEMLQYMGQLFTPAFCKDLVKKAIGPDARDGAIGRDAASALLFQRYAVLHLAPVGKQIVASIERAAAAR